jgi:hypothetical protein
VRSRSVKKVMNERMISLYNVASCARRVVEAKVDTTNVSIVYHIGWEFHSSSNGVVET